MNDALCAQPDGRLTVFVVEDCALLQQRFAEFFVDVAGAHVVGCATTAEDAIGHIARIRPDVVTVDLWLAHGTGFDVMRWMQSLPESRRPLYVVFSSNNDQLHATEALRLGAAAFFDKARDIMTLVGFLQKADRDRHNDPTRRESTTYGPDGPATNPASND